MKPLALSLLLLFSALAYAEESIVYSFQGGGDGQFPRAGLVADSAGNFFGTTEFGGNGPCTYIGFVGCGTIFELSPDGKGGFTETVLYTFQGGTDGQWPISALIVDAAGNLYGTTQIGGGTNFKCPPNCGSAFELSPGSQGWTLTVLHAFKGGNDGGGPEGGLAADANGNLYGVTYMGGTANFGTFYQLVPANGTWVFKKIHNFKNIQVGPDGGQPNGTPLLGVDGNLFGTTAGGGQYGAGVIYAFSKAKTGVWKEKIIHSFGSSTGDEGAEYGDLAQDSAGSLYGVGGNYAYRMLLANGKWKRKNIHHFIRSRGDGGSPVFNDLIVDAAGNVYGTIGFGPKVPYGRAYKLSEHGGKWAETVLYLFQGAPDGNGPDSKLFLDSSGNLWGTTGYGGTGADCGGYPGCGTVFEITP